MNQPAPDAHPSLNRPDLMDLIGERVTVTDTGPARTNTWTGTLAVLADQPSLMLDLDDGRRVVLLQYRCKVVRADDAPVSAEPPVEPLGLEPLAQLDRMLANLQQHIEQRAQELAQPYIDQANAEVAAALDDVKHIRERFDDLKSEFGRQRTVLERRADTAEAAIARVHAIHQPEQPPEGHQWLSGGRAPKCRGCDHEGNPFTAPDWPCPTIRALDGVEPENPKAPATTRSEARRA